MDGAVVATVMRRRAAEAEDEAEHRRQGSQRHLFRVSGSSDAGTGAEYTGAQQQAHVVTDVNTQNGSPRWGELPRSFSEHRAAADAVAAAEADGVPLVTTAQVASEVVKRVVENIERRRAYRSECNHPCA